MNSSNAGVTQLESQPSKLLVAGSSPVSALSADVAQLVEHFLGKEEVTGSIPVISSGLRIPLIENESKQFRNSSLKEFYECSSIGRVAVSKTVGWGFESLHSCT